MLHYFNSYKSDLLTALGTCIDMREMQISVLNVGDFLKTNDHIVIAVRFLLSHPN